MQARRVSTPRKVKVTREKRDQIVLEHLSLVRAIAVRVHDNLPVHVDIDDLVHAGVMGLFDAVDKFDPKKNVAFDAYAKHRIKGAILDSLRQLDWASRDLRKRQKQVETVTRLLTLRLGRSPQEGEMSEALGVTIQRWRAISTELHKAGLISPNTYAEDEADRMQEFAATAELRPDRMCEHTQLQSTLAKAVRCLPARYQKVVTLYYTNEMTMREIGDMMGVNESRISQIHKTALRKMQVALQSEGIHSAAAL